MGVKLRDEKFMVRIILILTAGFTGGVAGFLFAFLFGLILLFTGDDNGENASIANAAAVVLPFFGTVLGLAASIKLLKKRDAKRLALACVCLACGYDLRGNPNAPCPECGHTTQ